MRHLNLYVLCVTIALISGCVSSKQFQAKVEEASRYQVEVSQLIEEITALTVERDSLLAEIVRLQGENAQLNSRVVSLEEANASLQAAIEASKAEKDQLILQLTNDKQALQSELAALQAEYQGLCDIAAQEQQAQAMKMAELQSTYGKLVAGLQEQIGLGQIRIDSLTGILNVHIVDQILFLSGEAEVRTSGKTVLDAIAKAFNQAEGQRIVVEGHTDNVPIGEKLRERYPTNWELSTTRATNVVRYLIETGDINPTKVSVAGYGEYRPVATNTTKEGRARNRRIEIKFIPMD